MSESLEKMEGVEEQGADLDALKASARDIVEKAAEQNGKSEELNGVVENGDCAEKELKTNGDVKEVEHSSEQSSDKIEGDEEKKEAHSVNGNSETKKQSDSLPSEDLDKTKDSDTNGATSSEDAKNTESEDVNEDENTEKHDDTEKKEKVERTPKKKKKKDTGANEDSPPVRRSGRKKTPTKYAELEKEIDFVEEIDNDIMEVEEIKDDDSDIQEVEPEDPLGGASISITKSTKATSGKKPNVVTIDDLKTLQRLATSAKKTVDAEKKKENVTIIDTQAILAGKMGSGVSITPARPKSLSNLNISPAGLTLGSGVTIRPNVPKVPTSSVTITSTVTNNSSPSTAKSEDYDPNLTDDTFVVEAPSFIVPYVYEKPPKEAIKDFRDSVDKLQKEKEKEEKEKQEKEKAEKEEEKKKRREERQKRRDAGEEGVEDDTDDEKEGEEDMQKEDDQEAKGETKPAEKNEAADKEKSEEAKLSKNAYFESTLGKYFIELGMNLVQEFVQKDLLNQQKRRAHKDKSAAVMHAIMSLQKNLDDSKESNESFHHELRKCRFCSFRTESRVVMQHHMETPHMKNFIYRCNFCEYETKIPQEVLFHMDSVHGVKGKLERAPYFHQCPQCPFEDNGKGKLTRHKLGCDKRFKSEVNQTPERDWDPPAKIRPQQMRPGYSGYNYMQGRPGMTTIRPGQSLLPGRSYGGHNQRMPMMNTVSNRGGMASRGRPVGSYKGPADLRIPQPALNQQQNKMRGMSPQMLASQQMLAALNSQGLSVYGTGKSQSVNKSGSPSISITPLPGRNNTVATKKSSPSPSVKPGQPGAGQGKGSFVICEICDGYIKDLEQLRNHMQWIHKVKIHPKMIYNRPPLNCQKCQFRFFTDQGLERHLLGSHGLVTASMQDSANKGQDSGRCPVCGKVYQWKLLNHVAKDHNKTLKPAHLSYKCTVCTATFGQYKLFENHVYTAHSGVAKKADKAKQAAAKQNSLLKTTPKAGVSVLNKKPVRPKEGENEVIDLDDEEEIDDVEKDAASKSSAAEVIDLETPKKSGGSIEDKADGGSAKRSLDTADAEESEKKKSKPDQQEEEKAEEVKDD